MKIGIIGAGHIGQALAENFVKAGHTVAISNSRSPDTIAELALRLGARAVTAQEAADFGELLVETVPFGKYGDLPKSGYQGKVVIDTANLYPGRDGQIDLQGLSESAFMARHLPGARVVKAFNAIPAADLRLRGDRSLHLEDRRAIPVASDDEAAKKTVLDLVEQIGFAGVDAGSLEDSKAFQPDTPPYGADVKADELRALLRKA